MDRFSLAETIFAVAAGGRHSALTVLRLSGGKCAEILIELGAGTPVARMARLCALRDGSGRLLDRALVLWFPSPRSYTGEDCAELHLHGGAAVLEGVVDELGRLGARPAEAGEFTRRAFLNGKIDLLEAEAIADLVAAETDLQRDQALAQMRGSLAAVYQDFQLRLTRLMASLEAEIDFPDEVAETGHARPVSAELARLSQELERHLADDRSGEKLRSGLTIAIVGAPNVGKSTLVNALCGRDVSIVSAQPGTTRDAVEARAALGGVPLTFIDTAGLRDHGDPVELEGMRRARERARVADLVVWVTDRDGVSPPSLPSDARVLRVRSKTDLDSEWAGDLGVSALHGDGMATLRAALTEEALHIARGRMVPSLTRPRHRAALTAAVSHLRDAAMREQVELAAEDLRLAMDALARIGGGVTTEDVLDLVFGEFCIGK